MIFYLDLDFYFFIPLIKRKNYYFFESNIFEFILLSILDMIDLYMSDCFLLIFYLDFFFLVSSTF